MGEVCITTDFTQLNKSVILSCYSLLRPEDILWRTKGGLFFLKLNLIKGFQQIELHPDSRRLMATLMPPGLRHYICMPHGLTGSDTTFQCSIEGTLQGIKGVATYIDDILIFAGMIAAHDNILQTVLR